MIRVSPLVIKRSTCSYLLISQESDDEEYDFKIECYFGELHIFSAEWAFVGFDSEEVADSIHEEVGRFIDHDGWAGEWHITREQMASIEFNDFVIDKNGLDVRVTLINKAKQTLNIKPYTLNP